MAFTEDPTVYLADFGRACTLAGAPVLAVPDTQTVQDFDSGALTQQPSALIISAAAPAAKTANKSKKQQMPEKLSTAPAAAAVPAATPSFPVHPGQGKLAAEGFDHDNKVTYLTFSNGDKAVLLQKAVAFGVFCVPKPL